VRIAEVLARQAWTLERFGLTPRKLIARATNRREPAILCVSLPKAGTHLLERALCLHPRLYRPVLPTLHDQNIGRWGGLAGVLEHLRAGQILVSHLHFRPEYPLLLQGAGVRCVFLVRDPRDILVSQAFYIAGSRRHYLHDLFAALPDTDARIRIGITGDDAGRLRSLRERLSAFSGWIGASDMVVRYESLIGGPAEQDVVRQREALRALYGAVGIVADDTLLDDVRTRLFSRASPTFRTGATGQWTQHFPPDLLALLHGEAASEFERYGYDASIR